MRLWDARAPGCAMETRVHEGAVNELKHHLLPSGQALALTGGADRTVGAPARKILGSHKPHFLTGRQYGPAILVLHGRLQVLALEPRKGYQALHAFERHADFVYSLTAVGQYALLGTCLKD